MMGAGRKRQPTHLKRERRISVRGVRRDPPDLHKLSRALLAMAQAEAEAQAVRERAIADVETPPSQSHPEPTDGTD
jgi:hypothetical protein